MIVIQFGAVIFHQATDVKVSYYVEHRNTDQPVVEAEIFFPSSMRGELAKLKGSLLDVTYRENLDAANVLGLCHISAPGARRLPNREWQVAIVATLRDPAKVTEWIDKENQRYFKNLGNVRVVP